MNKKKDDSMEMLLMGLQTGLEKGGVKGTKILIDENGKETDITKNEEIRKRYEETIKKRAK